MTRLTTSMIGQHQVENAGMAIELYQIYCLKEKIPFREKEIIKRTKTCPLAWSHGKVE